MLIAAALHCRPGDGNLPLRFAPVGTQVGTPAWIPDTEEEESALYELDTGVTKHWFVHLRKINHRASDRTHVKMDTAGHNSRMSSRASSGIPVGNWPSGSSIVSAGLAGKLCSDDATVGGYPVTSSVSNCRRCTLSNGYLATTAGLAAGLAAENWPSGSSIVSAGLAGEVSTDRRYFLMSCTTTRREQQ